MPVVMAKARARIAANVMAITSLLGMLRVPEQGKDIRDRHHVLELFREPRKAGMDAKGRGRALYL
jgi:hypothetical protein